MPTAYRLPPRPVHATVPRTKAVDGLRKEFTFLSDKSAEGARVIYVTGLPGTGKKLVCHQYAEEFLAIKDGKNRIVSTWNLDTPESLFRSLCDLAVMMGAPANTETVIRRKCQLMTKRLKTAKTIYESKRGDYKLLLILTNVGKQMQALRQYWPQHGDKQWGDTQVLLCVSDVSELGLQNANINELSLNGGFIEEHAVALLKNLSCKSDDDEGAQYLVRELNHHPMTIAHTAIFLKSVLQNPENVGFGWKDCLVRLEKLKMGAVGQFNTKQSLALTSILENNYAVSQMAVNRLGSVNPYLEAAFQFLAFCSRDSLFCIPLDLISDFVMQGLVSDDDVENCKYENSVKATLRQCPLFLVPKASVNVKRVAVKDVLPKDNEGIFKSQLPPKTDLLPEVGSGSLTAAEKRPETPSKVVSPDEEKEKIKMAETFSSRPRSKEQSKPSTASEKIASRPETEEQMVVISETVTSLEAAPADKEASRPVTQEKPLSSQDVAVKSETPAKDASRPGTQEKSISSEVKAASKPSTAATEEKPATPAKSVTPADKVASKPSTAATEDKPATPAKSVTPADKIASKPSTAATEDKPATPVTKETSRPGTQEKPATPAKSVTPAATVASATPAQDKPLSPVAKEASSPGTQEKPATPAKSVTPAAKVASKPSTPATQDKPATPASKEASRPGTQEKPATPAKSVTPAAKVASTTPAQDKPLSPAVKEASSPGTQEKPATPAKSVTPAAKVASKPSTPATQDKPATPASKEASRPATQEKPETPAKSGTPAAKIDSTPATQDKPATPATKEASRPGTVEKSGTPAEPETSAEPSQEKSITPAITGDKPASRPATKEGSRPGTQGKDATAELPKSKEEPASRPDLDVRSAPSTPEVSAKEQIETKDVSEIDEDDNKVEAGEFKPLHAEPPRVEAGVFKPLMAEPPIKPKDEEPQKEEERPQTPQEAAAKMSGSIEKPSIDGRVSVGERLIETDIVEASLYGDQLISGEIPIKKQEGDILLKVEDCLRPFEDEVESLTFNEGVHKAFRKFTRNLVMRKIKSGQSSSSADTQSQQRKLQLEQFVKATKVLLMCYDKVYSSKEPKDLAFKRMMGPQLHYFVNCMLTKFNFKNRVAVRALKFLADSQILLGELVKAEETLETAQNIAFQCFHPTDMDLFDILRDRANILSRLGNKEDCAAVLEQCLTIVEQLDGEDMLGKEAGLLNELAQVHSNIGNLGHANALVERSLSIQESLHGPSALEICDTLSRMAMLRNKMGEPKQAFNQLQRVMRIQERHDVPKHEFSGTLCNMAAVNAALGEHEKSKVLYQSVLATQERQYGQWYPEIATTLSNLAMVHMALGEYEESKDALERVMKIRSRIYGKKHPLVASTMTNLASVLFTMGDHNKAMSLNEKALDIQQSVYPDAHPLIAVTMKNMAMIENSRSNLEKAKVLYERVLRMEELIYGELHPSVAATLNNLADTVLEQGETAKAAVLFQRAMETNEIVFGKNHPDIARNLNNLGRAFKEMGDYDGAKSKLTQALKMKEDRYGGEHINLVPTLMNLGDLFNLTKQPSRAKDVLTRSLKICEKNVGMRHPDTAKILRLLGNSYYLMGDLSSSEKILNRSLDILEEVYDSDHPYVLATRADLGACARPIGTRVF